MSRAIVIRFRDCSDAECARLEVAQYLLSAGNTHAAAACCLFQKAMHSSTGSSAIDTNREASYERASRAGVFYYAAEHVTVEEIGEAEGGLAVEMREDMAVDAGLAEAGLEREYRSKPKEASDKPAEQPITRKKIDLLRERTGLGLIDCQRGLSMCQGDVDTAADYLRAPWDFEIFPQRYALRIQKKDASGEQR